MNNVIPLHSTEGRALQGLQSERSSDRSPALSRPFYLRPKEGVGGWGAYIERLNASDKNTSTSEQVSVTVPQRQRP